MWILMKNWVFGPNITIIGDDVIFPTIPCLKASISKWEVVDKVSRQILKAMQIPEAQFLIINEHFHKKMKEKKPRLGNFFLAPLI